MIMARIALILAIIGGLNWGSIGLFPQSAAFFIKSQACSRPFSRDFRGTAGYAFIIK